MAFREARKKAGLSVAEAAQKLDVSRTAIWLWETGKGTPLVETLKKASALYGCTVDELLREDALAEDREEKSQDNGQREEG